MYSHPSHKRHFSEDLVDDDKEKTSPKQQKNEDSARKIKKITEDLWSTVDEGVSFITLDSLQNEDPEIIAAILSSKSDKYYLAFNLLGAILEECRYDIPQKHIDNFSLLLQKLLTHNLLTKEMLVPAVWLIAFHNLKPILTELDNKNLLTPQMLCSYSRNEETEESNEKDWNVLLMLAWNEHWDLINNLLQKGLITPETLRPAAENSVVLQLAKHNQIKLISEMLTRNWITEEILDAFSSYDSNTDHQDLSVELDLNINAVWFLADHNDMVNLLWLKERNLITTKRLLPCPKCLVHPKKDKNVLLLLASQRLFTSLSQWEQEIKPFARHINTQLLLAKPVADEHNFLSFLLKYGAGDMIKDLLHSELKPLEGVPWKKFDATLLIANLIKAKDFKTLEQLIHTGVKLDKAKLAVTINQWAVQSAQPELLEELVTICGESSIIPDSDDFADDSQAVHHYWKSIKAVREEAGGVKYATSWIEERARLAKETIQFPEPLIDLLLYYTLGNQNNIIFGWPETTDLAKNKINLSPLEEKSPPKSKHHAEFSYIKKVFNQSKGLIFFTPPPEPLNPSSPEEGQKEIAKSQKINLLNV